MSGESLREMIERAGSGCTIVASGGNSSARLPQPSSIASERVDSKRPSGFETAPRPVRTLGRVEEVMSWMVLDIHPVIQLVILHRCGGRRRIVVDWLRGRG